jgi:GDP-L-fucose synthase
MLDQGKDLTIKELAKKIKKIIGFSGKIIFDKKKPDGTKRKLLDVNVVKKNGLET